jgi:hypothetical protein
LLKKRQKREKCKVQNKEIIGREKMLKKWQKIGKWKVQNKEIIGREKMLKNGRKAKIGDTSTTSKKD